jgi:glycosyltransferase involved in cell wall biosynthesis
MRSGAQRAVTATTRESPWTPMPRRIVAIIATNEVSGPGRQLVSLATGLTKLGVEFTILLLNRPGGSPCFANFARDHGLDCRVVVDRHPLDPILLRDIDTLLSTIRPDVIQTHGYKPTGVAYALRRLSTRGAWVGFFEGETDKDLKDRIYNRAGLMMLRAADQVVIMSQLQRDAFPTTMRRRIHVVYNAAPDMARASQLAELPRILRRRRETDSGRLVGVVGRLSREKGVDIFLDSFALLRSRVPTVSAVVIGEGPLEAKLKAKAEHLNLGERVVFTGHLDDIASAYSALDLMVIPSRSEGLPSVLLEALQTDLPVVSTSVGAMIEIGAAYPEALDLVPSERPDKLAQSIAVALDRVGDPRRSVARRLVLLEFCADGRCRRMMWVYRRAMERSGLRETKWCLN